MSIKSHEKWLEENPSKNDIPSPPIFKLMAKDLRKELASIGIVKGHSQCLHILAHKYGFKSYLGYLYLQGYKVVSDVI